MEQVSKVLLRLELETRAHHPDADEPWRQLQRSTVTRADYIRQLVSVYGFEAPLEAACAYTPNLRLVIDLRERSRAGKLVQDLLALGASASELAQLPQCLPIAPFAAPIEALGWMYVSERATLLHEAVRQHVRAQLPEAADACTYLSAYEGVAALRWLAFGRVLDAVVRSDRLLGELVSAAHAGSRCSLAWQRDERVPLASIA